MIDYGLKLGSLGIKLSSVFFLFESSNKILCAGEKVSSNCPFLTEKIKATKKIIASIRLNPIKINNTLML
jgi:hypothetical protein